MEEAGNLMARQQEAVEKALERLRKAERARRQAIRDLIALGAIRSWGLVADLGERLAADYYAVELAPPSTPGYDLVTRDGRRVQVRTLRVTPENQRASIPPLREPYDVVLAIRLDEDYSPLEGIEVPREVIEQHYGTGRLSWTAKLANDPRTRRISAEELLTGEGKQ